MILLKEPIVINQTTLDALARMKGTLGFSKKFAWFVVFQDYKIEEISTFRKRWGIFGSKEIKSITYKLIEFKFHVWNVKRQTWTHLSEDGLYELLYDDDFPNMRKNYFTMIKAPLEFLGVTFKRNKIIND